MVRGKFKAKPTGQRQFSKIEDIRKYYTSSQETEYVDETEDELESEEESEERTRRRKGIEGLIEIGNPNLVKHKNLKVKDIDLGKITELSRHEREALEKQRARERYRKLEEEGKTEKARQDLERLTLIRQQRAEAVKKREEEKAAREEKKAAAQKAVPHK